jgi:hypothetical protein
MVCFSDALGIIYMQPELCATSNDGCHMSHDIVCGETYKFNTSLSFLEPKTPLLVFSSVSYWKGQISSRDDFIFLWIPEKVKHCGNILPKAASYSHAQME